MLVTKNYANVDEPRIDHDNLLNFVAYEHIDHSTVTATAGWYTGNYEMVHNSSSDSLDFNYIG